MELIDTAERFKSEREKLGFSQSGFARMLGTNRQAIRKAELGLSELKSGILTKAAKFGVDIQYVLTGVRSENIGVVEEKAGFTGSTSIKSVTGGIVAIGNGHTINQINTKNHITKTVATVKPGAEHITDSQASSLQGLVKNIVDTEARLKKKPATYRSVWGSLNSFCKAPKYRLIPLEDYGKARKYLDQWMGRLASMASAPVKDGDNWRRRHYAYIKINSKDEVTEQAVKKYMQRNFKVSSLTELNNDELEAVYRYVAGRRNKRK